MNRKLEAWRFLKRKAYKFWLVEEMKGLNKEKGNTRDQKRRKRIMQKLLVQCIRRLLRDYLERFAAYKRWDMDEEEIKSCRGTVEYKLFLYIELFKFYNGNRIATRNSKICGLKIRGMITIVSCYEKIFRILDEMREEEYEDEFISWLRQWLYTNSKEMIK